MKSDRPYYRQRVTGEGAPKLALEDICKMTLAATEGFEGRGFFQESFGKYCPDDHDKRGTKGDAELFLYTKVHLRKLWPPRAEVYESLDEVSLFTLIEVLFDCVSEPLEEDSWHHPWNGCGMHYRKFNVADGRKRWREEVNNFLPSYGPGFELSVDGEVQSIGSTGLRELMTESVERVRGTPDEAKVTRAVRRFRHATSSREDRADAIRDLADIHEKYKTKVLESLSKPNSRDLFQIANQFAIRHHDAVQKGDYDDELQTWIFHVYLAAAWLVLDLDNRAPPPPPPEPEPEPEPDSFGHSDDDIPF